MFVAEVTGTEVTPVPIFAISIFKPVDDVPLNVAVNAETLPVIVSPPWNVPAFCAESTPILLVVATFTE